LFSLKVGLFFFIRMTLLLTYCLFILPSLSSAEDTTRVFRLNDVVVTGTRSAVIVQELPSPVQVMDSAGLSRLNGISIADKLKHSAGLSLRTYGGNGALQAVSVRGMGSDYSLILLNGIRYTTFQIGTVDLGIFSEHDVERIEIANGGNSALYGADAVGGVINIITKRPSGKPFFSLAHQIGSYGLSGYSVAAGGEVNHLFIRGAVDVKRASNHFDFRFDDGLTVQRLQRNGADFITKSASVSIQRIFSEKIISTISLRAVDAERGQPAAVTGPMQSNAARIHDKDLFFQSVTEMNMDANGTVTVPISYRINRQTYRDPALITNGTPLDAFYENNAFSFGPTYRYDITANHTVTAGGELVAARIISNELIPSKRDQYSGFISSNHRFLVPVEIRVFPSIRYDAFSDITGGISSKLGANIGLLKDPVLRIRGSYGRNYRVPTFNDLYWIEGGNPALTPEHSLNGDAGLVIGIEREKIAADFDVGYFWIDAGNKIVWRPGMNSRWSPVNIQSVYSSGWEIGMTVNALNDLLSLQYHHTVLRAVKTSADGPNDATVNKILPFVPQETATISAGSSFAGFSANILYNFTGFRYETADNDPRYFLPTVETLDANLTYQFQLDSYSLRIKGEVNNLTNVNYQMITGYPLPLRQYAVITEITL
jgi:vitamin B12 transporter